MILAAVVAYGGTGAFKGVMSRYMVMREFGLLSVGLVDTGVGAGYL